MRTVQDWTRRTAGLQSVCAGCERLAYVTRANPHDYARAACQVADYCLGRTLSESDRSRQLTGNKAALGIGVLPSHGCHHENWLADVKSRVRLNPGSGPTSARRCRR